MNLTTIDTISHVIKPQLGDLFWRFKIKSRPNTKFQFYQEWNRGKEVIVLVVEGMGSNSWPLMVFSKDGEFQRCSKPE